MTFAPFQKKTKQTTNKPKRIVLFIITTLVRGCYELSKCQAFLRLFCARYTEDRNTEAQGVTSGLAS